MGVDNIDVEAATRRGILVLNSPESSTTSTAEHTMALLLALARRIPHAHDSVVRGEWARDRFVGIELYGKVLGIIGLGKIGTGVARRALSFGMQVRAHDPYVSEDRAARLGVSLVGLDELLASSDVFQQEPPPPSPLLQHPRVVVTPHIGASTREARRSVAVDVAEQVLAALRGRPVRGAVNAPALFDEAWVRLGPHLTLARTLGSLAQQLTSGQIEAVEMLYAGEVAREEPAPLTAAFLAGLFAGISEPPANIVSAPALARDRGIATGEVRREESEDFQSLLGATVRTSLGPLQLAGTLFGRREPRIVQIGDYRLDLIPAPQLLLIWNVDRPGMIGRVGTILGAHGVNIANMHVGRIARGGTALMVLTVDDRVPDGAMRELARVDGVTDVRTVRLE